MSVYHLMRKLIYVDIFEVCHTESFGWMTMVTSTHKHKHGKICLSDALFSRPHSAALSLCLSRAPAFERGFISSESTCLRFFCTWNRHNHALCTFCYLNLVISRTSIWLHCDHYCTHTHPSTLHAMINRTIGIKQCTVANRSLFISTHSVCIVLKMQLQLVAVCVSDVDGNERWREREKKPTQAHSNCRKMKRKE